MENVKALKENGFQGEYWGTDIGYCSAEYQPCGVDHEQEQQKTDKAVAKFLSRIYIIQMGLDVGAGTESIQNISQPWTYPTVRNLNTILNGTTPTELTVEIENEAPHTATYAFMLPDGDILLAVWFDGNVESDDYPGDPTNLVIKKISAQSVVGIDVLHSYVQELITDIFAGNLVIYNLLIKDYPIIIRFSGVSNP